MNKILETLEAEREELADWRHDFHMHPELGLEETRTAGIVAQKLRSWGIEVTEHVGVTGVVGVINGDLGPGRSIGLRCDMDALPITECSSQSWKSTVKGKMHACGHDGHTTMLLAAARYLSQHRNFRCRKLRSGTMRPFAVKLDREKVRPCHSSAALHGESTGLNIRPVVHPIDLIHGEAFKKTVFNHGQGAARTFFGRLSA